MIYDYLIGCREIRPYYSYRRMDDTPHPAYRKTFSIQERPIRATSTYVPFQSRQNVMLACTQLRDETRLLTFTLNDFRFAQFDAFYEFKRGLSSEQRNAIATVCSEDESIWDMRLHLRLYHRYCED